MEILAFILLAVCTSQLSAKSYENVVQFEMEQTKSEILDFIQRMNAVSSKPRNLKGQRPKAKTETTVQL